MTDRTAVVTGGGHGIGQAISRELVVAGWSVTAVDRDGPALGDVVRQQSGHIRPVVGDLADAETISRARADAESAGALTVWVNNAAVLADTSLHEMDDAAIDDMLQINLRAAILGSREAIRSFLDHRVPGTIINISSIHANHPFPSHPIYAAAKGALEALTRQICVEYGSLGIRCNAVAPGAVATTMTLGASGGAEQLDRLAAAAALSPMRRVSSAQEIAEAVGFLVSDRATSINGHVLAVDNGMSAHGRFPADR